MLTIEEALKPFFDQWLKESLPIITKKLRDEFLLDIESSNHQPLFNQQEMAKQQNVSVTTFKKWREMGLQAEPSPTGKVLFDLYKVNKWREENNKSKNLSSNYRNS